MAKFIMLVGVPGSGKSTYAERITEQFNENNEKIIILSSDAIRKEIYGDETCQDNPKKVFEIMQKRTLDALNNNINVIYDATNLRKRNRVAILNALPQDTAAICVVIDIDIKIAIERDLNRDRTVGIDVIQKMYKSYEKPTKEEGWQDIYEVIVNRKSC